MSMTVDVDLTKFDKIIAEGYDPSGGPIKYEIPKTTFTIPSPAGYPAPTYTLPPGAYVSNITFDGSSGLSYGGMTYVGSPGMFDGSFPRSEVRPVKQFTFDDFTHALHEVVVEAGRGYHYPSGMAGVYRNRAGKSACLIGAVLDRLDPAMLDGLPGLNGSADMVIGFALEAWFAPQDLRRIALASRSAQIMQDQYAPWDRCEVEFHRADRMASAFA